MVGRREMRRERRDVRKVKEGRGREDRRGEEKD